MIVLMAGQTICVALDCVKSHASSVVCKSQNVSRETLREIGYTPVESFEDKAAPFID